MKAGQTQASNQDDATGFIRLKALRLIVAGKVQRGEEVTCGWPEQCLSDRRWAAKRPLAPMGRVCQGYFIGIISELNLMRCLEEHERIHT